MDTDRPFAIWVHVALLKTKREVVKPTWLEAILNSEYCYRQSQKYTHGIANRDLGLRRMTRIEFYLPPKERQKAFVETIARVSSERNSMVGARETARNLFMSLQSRAFSGQL